MDESDRTLLESEISRPVETALTRPPANRPALGRRYVASQLVTALPLLAADLFAAMMAVSTWILLGFSAPPIGLMLGIAGVFVLSYAASGLYPGLALYPAIELRKCSYASITPLMLLGVCLAAPGTASSAVTTWFGIIVPLVLVCVPFFRSVARTLFSRSDRWCQPVIIFGSGHRAAELYRVISSNRRSGLRPLGFVDEIEAHWIDVDMSPEWYLGTLQETTDIATKHGVYRALICESVDPSKEHRRAVDRAASIFPHRLYAPGTLPPMLNHSVQSRSCGKVDLVYECDSLLLPVPQAIKRATDIGISLIVGVFAFPLMLLIGLVIKLTSPGPIFFAHQRLGIEGKPFRAFKFRTMRVDAAEVLECYLAEHPELRAEWLEKQKLFEDPRVTRLGRVLRKTSLDELPQLINVLFGEMSLIGPRPIVASEIARYREAYEPYCRTLPGIGGLWQVSGRNDTTYQERIQYDMEYVRNWSLWLDLYLLVRTIKVVLTRDGAY